MDAQRLLQLARQATVIPVIVIEKIEDAVPLADALVAGGLNVLEVTLRSGAALDAIREIAANVKGAHVGAGTVLDAAQWHAAAEAGSTFMVSPGFTDGINRVAKTGAIPWLPGVSSAAEIMRARDAGYTFQKFFPAEQAGGVPMLSAFSGPFGDIVFCPTGGVSVANAPSYLALKNVICVGGSWVVPRDLIAAKNWAAITELAKAAQRLRSR
jgi:2-dehydro-3-deoxyphosphogluconate aldolase / (4S)-4-hydroxy-2-oxoglutarate aldolase